MNNSLLALSHKLLYKPCLNPQWGKMSSASVDQEAGNTCRFVHFFLVLLDLMALSIFYPLIYFHSW